MARSRTPGRCKPIMWASVSARHPDRATCSQISGKLDPCLTVIMPCRSPRHPPGSCHLMLVFELSCKLAPPTEHSVRSISRLETEVRLGVAPGPKGRSVARSSQTPAPVHNLDSCSSVSHEFEWSYTFYAYLCPDLLFTFAS